MFILAKAAVESTFGGGGTAGKVVRGGQTRIAQNEVSLSSLESSSGYIVALSALRIA
jgi:hypothetical protein